VLSPITAGSVMVRPSSIESRTGMSETPIIRVGTDVPTLSWGA
jgi:hypothetical protein